MTDANGTPFRQLVVASAGSGKTFQLSSRLIGLLAAEVPPERILASTFTRKAAGEILERVLERLAGGALDENRARALAESLPEWPGREALATPAGCRALLADLAGRLHRLQVYTLDAFFHRAVRAFALELGLPERWGVADEAASERLRVRAVERVLDDFTPAEMAELLRGIDRGRVQASVHRGLLDQISELHADYRSLAPGVEDPWGLTGEAGGFEPIPRERWEALVPAVVGLELPRNKGDGKIPASWRANVAKLCDSLLAMDAGSVLGVSLVCRHLEGGGAFGRKPISTEVAGVLDRVIDLAQSHQLHLLDRGTKAMGRFVERYDREIRRLRREEGVYEFGDLAFALIEGERAFGGGAAAPEALYYRLDGEVRHLLLDEFQDTSVVQWRALEPLVHEILSGYESERVVYLVGDPKQSIYGWRGGEPRILERVGERYEIPRSSLDRSWRSSPVILDLVNRVFGDLPSNPAFGRSEEAEAVEEWMRGFSEHSAQFEHRPGRWVVEVGPGETDDEDEDPPLRRAAERVRELRRELPGASIGVLTRKRKEGARILAHLKSWGIEASGEGGVPLTDSAPVLAVLALLKMTDHPGDRPSRYLVGHTPLAELVGLRDWASDEQARRVAAGIRSQLLERGYGEVVGEWVRHLIPAEGERDRVRLRQLAELAARWEARATLRPGDLVEAARRERRELPGDATVRIMTIHASKGLQFDVVVLPETGGSWRRGTSRSVLAARSDPTGPVLRLVPAVPDALAGRAPEAAAVVHDEKVSSMRDQISSLYVAITRTRYALHVLIPPDGKSVSGGLSGARVLRCALGDGSMRAEPGTIWAEGGDPGWWKAEVPDPVEADLLGTLRRPVAEPPARRTPRIELAPSPRRRLLERLTPSSMEGGDRVALDQVLRRPARGALDLGSLVHRLLEGLEWLPEGGAEELDREPLVELARREAPRLDDPAAVVDELLEWLAVPEVARLLDRDAWPAGTTARRELPFIVRRGGGIVQGVADRVLRVPGADGDRLVVVDWKTDRVGDGGPLADRIDHYRPQIRAYSEALAPLERVPEERVEGLLVFLRAGVVAPVPDRSGESSTDPRP